MDVFTSMQMPPPLPPIRPPPLPPSIPATEYTGAGLCLFILTGIVTVAFAVLLLFWLMPTIMPVGRVPAIFVMIAIVVFGGLFFFAGDWVLTTLGVSTSRPRRRDSGR